MPAIERIHPGNLLAKNDTGTTPPDLLGISVVIAGLGIVQLGFGLLAYLLPPSSALEPIALQFLVPGIFTVVLAIGTYQRRPIAWVTIAGISVFLVAYILTVQVTASIFNIAKAIPILFLIAYLGYRRGAFFS